MGPSKSNKNGGPACRPAGLRFKPLDHPSDVGLLAFGKNTREIFENAAFGMFALMGDLDRVEENITIPVKVAGDSLESLLINWLNELLYYEDSRKILFKGFKINNLTETELAASVSGEKIDPKKHAGFQAIKAATYNQLQISANQARIIFDV